MISPVFYGFERKYPPYSEAKAILKHLKIKTVLEYKSKRKSLGLPSTPDQYYESEWESWPLFLDNGHITIMSYEKFLEEFPKLGVKTSTEYASRYPTEFKKLGFPSQPNRTYKKDWKGWKHLFQLISKEQ